MGKSKEESHHQGRDCQTLLLRDPRPAANPPAKLRRRLQLRQTPQNPQGPHPIRIRLQSLEGRASEIQTQSAPANAGTKQLEHQSMRALGQWPMTRPEATYPRHQARET